MRQYLITILPLMWQMLRLRRLALKGIRRTIPGWGKGPIRLPRPIRPKAKPPIRLPRPVR